MDLYTFLALQEMKQQCYNPKSKSYAKYGARGITVCASWLASLDTFAEDVGPRPSPHHELVRIDNNKGYGPSNVRWLTYTPQKQKPPARLTEKEVRELLHLVHTERCYHGGVAVAFGVSDSTARAIALGERRRLADYQYPTALPKNPNDKRRRSYAERTKLKTTEN